MLLDHATCSCYSVLLLAHGTFSCYLIVLLVQVIRLRPFVNSSSIFWKLNSFVSFSNVEFLFVGDIVDQVRKQFCFQYSHAGGMATSLWEAVREVGVGVSLWALVFPFVFLVGPVRALVFACGVPDGPLWVLVLPCGFLVGALWVVVFPCGFRVGPLWVLVFPCGFIAGPLWAVVFPCGFLVGPCCFRVVSELVLWCSLLVHCCPTGGSLLVSCWLLAGLCAVPI